MSLTRSQLLTGSAAALAWALALGGATGAAAQTATPTPGVPRAGPHTDGPCLMAGAAAGVPAAVLQRLGLRATQVAAERQAGKSLAQIAQGNGVDKATLIDLLVAEHKTALDARVKAGALTQAQADTALAQMRARVAAAVDRTEVGPPAWAGPGNGGLGLGFGPGGMARGAGRGVRPPWAPAR